MSDTCKLCHASVHHRFSKTVLGRHQADYQECEQCGCLQVASAPWLPEAYATESWAIDTGLVARNLQLAGRLGAFLERACEPGQLVVDFGGGTGMLTRLLRDMGWNVLCHDPYRKPLFVSAFHVERVDGLSPAVVIASEVFEHFDRPRESLEVLLRAAPIIAFTTELYAGQGPDWWYLAPDLGQHVFFFSQKALAGIATGNGYQFVDAGLLKFLVRQDLLADERGRARMQAALKASADGEAGVAALVPYLKDPYLHVAADYQRELEASRRAGAAPRAEAPTATPAAAPAAGANLAAGGDRAAVFSAVYATSAWGTAAGAADGFDSGWGSDPRFSVALAQALTAIAGDGPQGVSVVDVGCGDFRTGSFLLDQVRAISSYEAIDIVPELIVRNRQRFGPRYPKALFRCLDAVESPLPAGDVVLIRQVLQHLGNQEALSVIQNARRACRRMLVVVEHIRPLHPGDWNLDKPPSADIREGKGMNLRLPPFQLPVAEELDVPLNETERLRLSFIPPAPRAVA